MVYLTFIKQTELCAEGWFLPNNVHQTYSLAKFLEKNYGKPSVLVVAHDDACIIDGKLVNLVFGVHGIQVTNVFSNSAQVGESEKFIQDLLNKAEMQNIQHIVIVLPLKQFEKFVQTHSLYILGCVNSAESWRNMYISAQKHLIAATTIPHCELRADLLNLFINAIELSPFA